MQTTFQKLTTFFAVGFIACSYAQADTLSVTELADSYNGFGLKFFAETAKATPRQNIFVSPISVAFALAMLREGAAAETEKEIIGALHLSAAVKGEIAVANRRLLDRFHNLDPDLTLEVANSLWIRKGTLIEPSFLNHAAFHFGAQVSGVDFADPKTTATIDDWVKEKTRGKIWKVDVSLRNSQAALLNVIYFKGRWAGEFEEHETRETPFYLHNGTQRPVPMMRRHADDYSYFETETFQAVQLPYGAGKVSMHIFLPRTNSSLESFERALTLENWGQWMQRFAEREGTVLLPRFKFSQSVSLAAVLKRLGISKAFDPLSANFSKISPLGSRARLFIHEAQQKTFVEVNERGTEAVAVDEFTIDNLAYHDEPPKPPFKFLADRPFFIAIRDNQSGAILFMGAIFDPQ